MSEVTTIDSLLNQIQDISELHKKAITSSQAECAALRASLAWVFDSLKELNTDHYLHAEVLASQASIQEVKRRISHIISDAALTTGEG